MIWRVSKIYDIHNSFLRKLKNRDIIFVKFEKEFFIYKKKNNYLKKVKFKTLLKKYNKNIEDLLDLNINKGDEVCPKCKGKSAFMYCGCTMCYGSGKLDWIEFIKGGKENRLFCFGDNELTFADCSKYLCEQIDNDILREISYLSNWGKK
jgi:hypothetical protein